jgi:hypothetical protein
MVPSGLNETCFVGLLCSFKVRSSVLSLVPTSLTVSSSLATAHHLLSGERATSRTGREVRWRKLSNMFEDPSEYLLTVPSSAPAMKKSLPVDKLRFCSWQSSMLVGSPSKPVL